MSVIRSFPFGEGEEIVVQFGKIARQANFATTVRVGDTIILVAVVASSEPREGIDFFPLLVDYREKFYASGRIPGGFFKREGRPSDGEMIKARLIDRPLRPLFPDDYRNDVQIYVTTLSIDMENNPEVPAIFGASLSLLLSDIPFENPIAAVRIGRVDGKFIVNPTLSQLENSDMNIVAVGVEEGINMIEVNGNEVSEEDVTEALKLAHEHILKLIEAQKQLRTEFGKEKQKFEKVHIEGEIVSRVASICEKEFDENYDIQDKDERRMGQVFLLPFLALVILHYRAAHQNTQPSSVRHIMN